MRDGGAERALLRLLGIDVNPLVVAGRLGELVDPLLLDLQPVGVPQLLTDGRAQLVDRCEDPRFCHVPTSLIHMSKRLLSMDRAPPAVNETPRRPAPPGGPPLGPPVGPAFTRAA